VVVDDGSQDNTLKEAKRFAGGERVKLFTTPHQGKGSVVRMAIREASGYIMVQLDTDRQCPVEGMTALIQPILEGRADITLGSRYLGSSRIEEGAVSVLKRIASYITAVIVSIICGHRYTDVFAGFKAWRAQAIKTINIQEDGLAYEAEIAIKAKRHGHAVVEVSTDYRRGQGGGSKIKFT